MVYSLIVPLPVVVLIGVVIVLTFHLDPSRRIPY